MINKTILLILFAYVASFSQIPRETRAVWLASNFRLDWPPPTYEVAEQKQALIRILDNLEHKNYNTIFFQVRFNATVLFESAYEPWSYYMSGKVGGIPEYDPLDFVIKEAHKRGIEVHAWFNMMRCFNGSEQNVFEYPGHIMNTHPEWVRKITTDGQISYWLDPGIPEVQNYLSNVVIDLAEKYEIDGIQLDYIRYPSREMDDAETYLKFGNGADKDQWRRNNITAVVRNISRVVNAIDPDIKLGAAPIGVYINKPSARGMQAYSEVFQESRAWLKEGLMDYLAPQIYWNFDGDPKFNLLVDDWVSESASKNIVVGIASYKPEVKPQSKSMIEYTRKSGASGIAFFRYSFVQDENYFDTKSFPAAMPWKAPRTPKSPYNLNTSLADNNNNRISISWLPPESLPGGDHVEYYSIYNLDTRRESMNSENLFKIIQAENTTLNFAINNPNKINYYFAVKSLDKFWNESVKSSGVKELQIPTLKAIAKNASTQTNPVLIKSNGSILLLVQSSIKEALNITNESGLRSSHHVEPGLNILEIDSSLNSSKQLDLTFIKSGTKTSLRLR